MAITLASVKGHKEQPKDPELNVVSKDNVLQIKENKRMKRREIIQNEMDKVVKDPF
jgi:hypothetical protein